MGSNPQIPDCLWQAWQTTSSSPEKRNGMSTFCINATAVANIYQTMLGAGHFKRRVDSLVCILTNNIVLIICILTKLSKLLTAKVLRNITYMYMYRVQYLFPS